MYDTQRAVAGVALKRFNGTETQPETGINWRQPSIQENTH